MGETAERLWDQILGGINPFAEDYLRQELKWYGQKALKVAPVKKTKTGVQLVTCRPDGILPDYLNKNFRIDMPDIPMLFIDGELWMSLTPMEIQSQFLAIRAAGGLVGVAGLGMGYAALKMAQSDNVDRVVVFEMDLRVIKFFRETFKRRKGFKKIEFVEGDARKTIPRFGEEFDLLYVDIYQTLLADEIIDDIKLFETCVREFPDCYMFWGLERVLVDALIEYEVINGFQLDYPLRAYLSRWMKTPVSSTDKRLADIMLSNMYEVAADPEYVMKVLDALGMEHDEVDLDSYDPLSALGGRW